MVGLCVWVEIFQGLKPHIFPSVCGTTEVVP